MAKSPFPWKRHFMKIPSDIAAKVQDLSPRHIQVAAEKHLLLTDIGQGLYSHLGIRLEAGSISYSPIVAPPRTSGRWSRTNVDGRVDRLRHLPKVPIKLTVEVPNYGDWSRGSHEITQDRMIYLREYVPAKHLTISVASVEELEDSCLFHFTVNEVLDPASTSFEAALLNNLNLLQENVGVADVLAADSTREAYLATEAITWESLPLEEWDELQSRLQAVPDLPPAQRDVAEERAAFLATLKPKSMVVGTSGFHRYYGAVITDSLVVFENLRYGNAIYMMTENWQANSHLSRTELLTKAQLDFIRIRHTKGWMDRIRHQVSSLRVKHKKRPAAPARIHK